MDISQAVKEVKQHPEAGRIGMILSHIGIVRGFSSDGSRVSGLTVAVDHGRLQEIIEREKQSEGIVDIRVEIAENRPLAVGDEIMTLVVAGDLRDNVLPVLERTLNAIKEEATSKIESCI